MKFLETISQEPTLFLSKKLWRFSQGMHKLILLYLGMSVAGNLILLVHPLIFGAVVADIQSRGITQSNLPYITFLLSLLLLQTLLFWLVYGPARVIERIVAFRAQINFRHYLMSNVLDLGLSWHGEHDSGDTIDKVNKAGEGLSEFGQNVYQIIQLLVKLLGTTAVLMWFSPGIGFGVFVFVVISFIVLFQFDKRLLPQYRRLNEYSNKASASIFDALSNVTTVKILHIEKPVLDGVIARFKDSYPLYRSNAKLNEWKWFTGNMFFQGLGVIPLVIYLYYAVASGISIDAGTVSTLYLYLSDLVFVWFGFGSFYEQLALFKNRILNAAPIEEAFAARSLTPRRQVAGWNQCTLKDLTFSYDSEAEKYNLDNVAMTIKRGERVAMIGESGSGKSTFLKVLHGMYPNAYVTVAVDEEPPFDTCLSDIDMKTMLVPQEPEIFSSTLRENITLGIAYNEESVLEAARIAAFDKVIATLPNGLDSIINEKGVNLSGGQKQRLALARAILFSSGKDVILLDESTSSVDLENETEIYQNIFDAFQEKTVIASIHKMNLLKLFDRIVMFEESRIVDEGTFEELLARNDSFRESWEQFISAPYSEIL